MGKQFNTSKFWLWLRITQVILKREEMKTRF